jgi:hypothetical protein
MNTKKLHAQLARALAPLDANDVPISMGSHKGISIAGAKNSPLLNQPERWSVITEPAFASGRLRSAEVGLAGLAGLCADLDVAQIYPAREVQASGCSLDVAEVLGGCNEAEDVIFCFVGAGAVFDAVSSACAAAVMWDQLGLGDSPEVDYGCVHRSGSPASVIVQCRSFDHAVLDAIDFIFREISKSGKRALVYIDMDYIKAGEPFIDLIDKKLCECARPGVVVVRAFALGPEVKATAMCVVVPPNSAVDIEVSDLKRVNAVWPLDFLIWCQGDICPKISIVDAVGAEAIYPPPADDSPCTRSIYLGGALFQVTHAVFQDFSVRREAWVRCIPFMENKRQASARSAPWRLRLVNEGLVPAEFRLREASDYGVKFEGCSVAPVLEARSDGAIRRADAPNWTLECLIKHLVSRLKQNPRLTLNEARASLIWGADQSAAA